MGLKLNGATSGSIELDVPADIGSDLSMTVPATAGTILAADPTKLSVDSSGRLLHPARPSFLARGVGASTDQPTSGDTALLSTLIIDTTNSTGEGCHNIGNHYNTSTGLFTCPVDGLYMCYAHARWETASFTQNNYIRLFVKTVGTGVSGGNGYIIHQISGNNEAWTSYADQSVTGVLYCSAGMQIGMYGGMNSGTAKIFQSESSFGVTFLG
jgi:hypothetical protein